MTLNHDTQFLQLCTRQIENKLSWRPAEEWRNFEFTELSDKILDVTGVNLSTTTLKRVFGKLKYDSLPSTVTLNALASFLGYSNWMDFKTHQNLAQDPPPATEKIIKRSALKTRIRSMAAVAIAIILVLAFTFLSGKSVQGLKNEKEILFTSKPLANGLPNSVVFNVDLKGNKPTKAIIQQSWDSTKTVSLQTGQTEATGIYYFPGYFRAKLILDGKIVKEHDLFIRSDTWMATIDHQPVPTYVKEKDLLMNDAIAVSDTVLRQVKNEIGDIHGFSLFLSGPGILKTLYSEDETSSFIVTVRGEKGHRDIEVSLGRTGPMSWSVSMIRIVYS